MHRQEHLKDMQVPIKQLKENKILNFEKISQEKIKIRKNKMEAKAKQTDIKMTARKLRRVINEVRGKAVKDAQDMLRFMPYFAARVVEKNLKAAVANAQELYGVSAESLKISEIFADESTTYKRAKARAQGRMYKRLKRTSHLTLKVSDTNK